MKYQVSQKQVTRPTYDEIFDTHEEAEKYLNEIANEDYNGDKSGLEIRESELSLAAAAMGRAKTEKKAKSSRENGKKGGRPRTKFKTITKNEVENGFINSEVVDYENRVMSGDLTPEEKEEIKRDYAELAELMRED